MRENAIYYQAAQQAACNKAADPIRETVSGALAQQDDAISDLVRAIAELGGALGPVIAPAPASGDVNGTGKNPELVSVRTHIEVQTARIVAARLYVQDLLGRLEL